LNDLDENLRRQHGRNIAFAFQLRHNQSSPLPGAHRAQHPGPPMAETKHDQVEREGVRVKTVLGVLGLAAHRPAERALGSNGTVQRWIEPNTLTPLARR
jgi:hypothetical protein